MKVSRKALVRTGLGVAVAALIVGVIWGNVYVTNKALEQDRDPVTITPTTPVKGEPGAQGPKGDKGDRPSPQEVRQAVADYCAQSGLCEGKAPSASVVYAAVTRYCAENRCQGEAGVAGKDGTSGAAGRDGRDAAPVTDAQIQQQVTAYCAEFGCTGPAGADGEDGLPGESGRTPVIACVLRSGGLVDTQYVAWRYEDEPVTAFRDIYQVPTLAPCSEPVDLRG